MGSAFFTLGNAPVQGASVHLWSRQENLGAVFSIFRTGRTYLLLISLKVRSSTQEKANITPKRRKGPPRGAKIFLTAIRPWTVSMFQMKTALSAALF